jgi:DNA mismatch endonuclease, patch repair protein
MNIGTKSEHISKAMRAVKSNRNKSTELRLIEYFKQNKITGWRRKYPLVGKPDFVFPLKRIVVFADGCFWHGHNCRNLTPKTNQDYWHKKIDRNKKRDKAVAKLLRLNGWTVIRIWECNIYSQKSRGVVFVSRLKATAFSD